MEEWLSTGPKLHAAAHCLSSMAILLQRCRGSMASASFMEAKLSVLLQEATALRVTIEEDLGTLHVLPVEILDKLLLLSGGRSVRGICRHTRLRFDNVNSVLLLEDRRQNYGTISLNAQDMMEKLSLSTPQLRMIQACNISAGSNCALHGALIGAQQTLRTLVMKDLVMDCTTAPAMKQLYNLEVLHLDNCRMDCDPLLAGTIMTSILKGALAQSMRSIKMTWPDPRFIGVIVCGQPKVYKNHSQYGKGWLVAMLPGAFTELDKLTSLVIITDASNIARNTASVLTHTPLLEELRLSDTSIESYGWLSDRDIEVFTEALQRLQHLRCLDLQTVPFSTSTGSAQTMLHALGHLENLQYMAITFCDFEPMAAAEDMRDIEDATTNLTTPLDVIALSRYTNCAQQRQGLKVLILDLSGTRLSEQGKAIVMAYLIGDGATLEELCLEDCNDSIDVLSQLEHLPQLQNLSLLGSLGPLLERERADRLLCLTTMLRQLSHLQRLHLNNDYLVYREDIERAVPDKCRVIFKSMSRFW